MSNQSDLAQLMVKIDLGYQFTNAKYPALNEENEHEFSINHSLLHMNKSLGVMAAEVEKADHGDKMDHSELVLATQKQLVNVLKLACHLGITVPDIKKHISDQFG